MLALTLTLLLCDSKVVYDTLAAHVADAVSDDDTVNRDDDKLRRLLLSRLALCPL